MELYKPIYAELQNQGHVVYLQKDVILPYDWRNKRRGLLRRSLLWLFSYITMTPKHYWKKKISEEPAFNVKYDLLFCIDGTSFHPFLLSHLKKQNPNIHTVLYLWDSNNHYNFFINNKYFERIYTFDLNDAESDKRVNLLPSYWVETPKRSIIYSICMVGSDHDGRLEIANKVYNQVGNDLLPPCLKVVVSQPTNNSGLISFINPGRYETDMVDFKNKIATPCATIEKQNIESIMREIDESICVLDTDMPVQSGATQRVIWALARGKKLISTNYNLKRMPFYNSEQIRFIDRSNPVIDVSFLKEEMVYPISEEIKELRIDKWVHKLIDFE